MRGQRNRHYPRHHRGSHCFVQQSLVIAGLFRQLEWLRRRLAARPSLAKLPAPTFRFPTFLTRQPRPPAIIGIIVVIVVGVIVTAGIIILIFVGL